MSGEAARQTQVDPPSAIEAPARRVVMLGASNLAIHLPTVVETARLLWGSPLDVMAALGHGRSYGMTSCVLGRELPGILRCGLWKELESRPEAPTAALVTDIGNDLLYARPAEQIARWVEECLLRLKGARPLIVTELPLASTQAISPRRFRLLRTVLFPRCRLTFEETLAQALELNARVQALAEKYGVVLVEPSSAWYGFDPIHIRRTRGAAAWRELLGPWSPSSEAGAARVAFAQRLALRRLRPLERRMWGVAQHQPQPAGRLPDGTTISLY